MATAQERQREQRERQARCHLARQRAAAVEEHPFCAGKQARDLRELQASRTVREALREDRVAQAARPRNALRDVLEETLAELARADSRRKPAFPVAARTRRPGSPVHRPASPARHMDILTLVSEQSRVAERSLHRVQQAPQPHRTAALPGAGLFAPSDLFRLMHAPTGARGTPRRRRRLSATRTDAKAANNEGATQADPQQPEWDDRVQDLVIERKQKGAAARARPAINAMGDSGLRKSPSMRMADYQRHMARVATCDRELPFCSERQELDRAQRAAENFYHNFPIPPSP